jgi:hypothetical protein
MVDLMPSGDHELGDWWIDLRKRFDVDSRALFDSLLLLISWRLWKERNARVFGCVPSSVHDVVAAITAEGEEWASAGYAPLLALQALQEI